MLNVGTEAPDFSLEDQDGNTHTLSEQRGRWVVLYFYPEDDTPGCTAEACSFRDGMSDLANLDAVVLGVSADDRESHAAFARKYDLNFPLLSDLDHATIRQYQAWGEKERDGQRSEGILRISYLIDPQGKVAQTWSVSDPATHAVEVREALERHSGQVPA